MKTLRHIGRSVLFAISYLVLPSLLIGGGIFLWKGVSTQDTGLMIVSSIMVFCAVLGGLGLLQALRPRINILSPNVLTIIFWSILGLPVLGLVFLMGVATLYGLWQDIFQGKLLSLTWREFQQYFIGLGFGLGLPLSIFAAWIKSRKLGRPMHEVWEEWLGSLGRR
jgi:hypothetical protein